MDIPPPCDAGNDYDGRIGLRIASIFIIWFGSTLGAVFPTFAKNSSLGIPTWAFFIAKFFGSGVIIATAFVHLLSPAEDALRNPCLTGPITQYDWVSGIILMVVLVMCFVEIMVMRYATFGEPEVREHAGGHSRDTAFAMENLVADSTSQGNVEVRSAGRRRSSHIPGEDHFGHARAHNDIADAANPFSVEDYKAQLTAVFILEFGVVFHSVFVGLTLAVAGDEFITLFIVLVFHQTFEGLGLGSRLAVTPWPKGKRWTPYVLGAAYGVSTPLAIAIGLGVRKSYTPGSQTALLVNGVFDSISAGILIYTGLVELLGHELLFSPTMRNAKPQTLASALFLVTLGATLMALLGEWA